MDKIVLIDLFLFALFLIIVVVFLYKKRSNLKREGIIFLYKTKKGINFMNEFANKNKKFLRSIGPIIIIVSILLMVGVIFLFLSNAYFYVTQPKRAIEITRGAPPIAPVIPYFPQLFGMKSFFPNFYFVYFIIVFSIVAFFHEIAHGIYMVLYKVKIKSTGILFLGPILGAFVEQDDKEFRKKKNLEQMTTLGAGVFANFVLAIIFLILLFSFFFCVYEQNGYLISDYAKTTIKISDIKKTELLENNNFTIVYLENGEKYLLAGQNFEQVKKNLSDEQEIVAYFYAPAILNNLSGYITEIDGKKIRNSKDILGVLKEKKPGEEIAIKTEFDKIETNTKIKLEVHPLNSSLGFIGVPIITGEQLKEIMLSKERNPIKKAIIRVSLVKDPLILYKSKINSLAADYVYYLIWWCMMINLFVALFNMLPFGIFDGGRFSYLLILSLVKSEEKAKKIQKIISSIIILSLFLIIFSWVFAKIVF